MNQRIRDLWEQSTGAAVPEEGFYSSASKYNIEKFAELIVRECAGLVGGQPHFDKMLDCATVIEQHFGVK